MDVGSKPFRSAYGQELAGLGRFTVAVLGRTGVGKSTLVNAVFGDTVAETGIGRPVTQSSHLYTREGVGLGVIDTKGLEIGRDTDLLLQDLRELVEHSLSRPEHERLHVVWFGVQAADLRIQDGERAVIEALDAMGIPVVLVMTRVPMLEGRYHPDAVAFHQAIQAMGLPIAGGSAVPVMAQADDFAGLAEHGLPKLLERTRTVVPQGIETALLAAQRVDQKAKAKAAKKAVTVAATQAGAAAASPIPFADAAILVPIQLRMMSRIALLHNVPVDRATMLAMASVAVSTGAGRSLATGLVKLIPGAGTVVGGAVGAGVAYSVTSAVGYAWIAVCRQYGSDSVVGSVAFDPDILRKAFAKELKRRLAVSRR